MVTRFEAVITLLSALTGMLVVLITLVWKARGWVDRLNDTDARLADAIEGLSKTTADQHRDNQLRFRALERQLGMRGN